MPAGGYTDRSEMYHPDDTMKSATLDLKNRHRIGSVPFAQNEDVDPQYFGRDGEVSIDSFRIHYIKLITTQHVCSSCFSFVCVHSCSPVLSLFIICSFLKYSFMCCCQLFVQLKCFTVGNGRGGCSAVARLTHRTSSQRVVVVSQ